MQRNPVSTARAFNWTFTCNNPEWLPHVTDFEEGMVEYMIYQEELAPTTGTHHLQGFIRFTRRIPFASIAVSLSGLSPHLEVARGTPAENRKYCSKDTFPGAERYEYGVCPVQERGKRTDIVALRDGVKEGKSFLELADDEVILPTLARHMGFYQRLLQEAAPKIHRPNIAVRFCVGPAGTGKSTCAGLFDTELDAYPYDRALNGFWDGYTGQKSVIFDEMSGAVMSPTEFNRVCDKGPYRVNVKNGSAWLAAEDIRITANYMPEFWWKEGTRFNYEALSRRITECHLHMHLDQPPKIWKSTPGKDALTAMKGHLSLSGLDGRFWENTTQ